MESQSIDAVFENGIFRPIVPAALTVRDGEKVRLRIESSAVCTSLEQAAEVYEGLSPAEIADVERIALDRSQFFDATESA